MMGSNKSLPSILTPKYIVAVSAICLDRSDLACTCFSGRFLVQNCGRARVLRSFQSYQTVATVTFRVSLINSH